MSAGDRVADLVGQPVTSTVKGAAKGTLYGAAIGGVGAFLLGAAVVGAIGFGLFALPVLGLGLGLAHFGLIGAAAVKLAWVTAGILGGLLGAGVGGVAAGVSGGISGGGMGLSIGTVMGVFKGLFTGIKRFVGGSPTQVPENEANLQALREQAGYEQARAEAALRQMQRANAVDGLNVDASGNQVAQLQTKTNTPSVNTPGRG